MQKCLAQAKEASRDNERDALQHSDGSQNGHFASSEKSYGPSPLFTHISEPSGFDFLSAFIERLQMMCVYHGYLALTDPSISLERLRRQFIFPLSMMDRESLASYFEAALHARTTQEPLKLWTEMPFFNLGHAGTHYPRYTTAVSSDYRPYREYTTVEDPLSRVSPEDQEELSGEWFDVHDLKGYLRERGVNLLANPPTEEEKSFTPAVNTARFVRGRFSINSYTQGSF